MLYKILFAIISAILIFTFSEQIHAQVLSSPIHLSCPDFGTKMGFWRGFWNGLTIIGPASRGGTREQIERLTCYRMHLIDEGKKESSQQKLTGNLLSSLFPIIEDDISIYLANGYHDDLLATLLTHLLSADPNDKHSGAKYRLLLAMIYANPSSKVYDPEKAMHLFRRVYVLSNLFKISVKTNFCHKAFEIQRRVEHIPALSIRGQALKWTQSLCSYTPKRLLNLAQAFENGEKGLIQDPGMALRLYEIATLKK